MNVQKTKIVVFRNGGNIRNNEKWTYKNDLLKVVNKFTYLGIVLNFNGKFLVTV